MLLYLQNLKSKVYTEATLLLLLKRNEMILKKLIMKIEKAFQILSLLILSTYLVNGQEYTRVKEREIKTANRPNVLIIMTDEQSATMLSCAGNKWLQTPALDTLAAKGVRFEKAYVTNPVCCPSRFSIQTGHFPSAIGLRSNRVPIDKDHRPILQNLKAQSMGNIFRNAGYETYYGGKDHFPGLFSNSESEDLSLWGYKTFSKDWRAGLARDASEFLTGRRSTDKPFLLFVSFINPHDICWHAFQIPQTEPVNSHIANLAKHTPPDLIEALKMPAGVSEKDFFDKYCPPLPDNFQPMFGESWGVDSITNRDDGFQKYLRANWTDNDWRMHRWAYARLTEKVDSLIGIVLKALERSEVGDSTIVVFTSDHGDMDGSHKLDEKIAFYEEAARVPFIVSYPWLKEKGRVDTRHLVSNGLDLLPTICDLAGIQSPKGIQGLSLLPILEDGKASNNWRDHIFMENEVGYCINTGRYKYTLEDKYNNGIREVFSDLAIDPGETCNMINVMKYSKIISQLRKELLAHLKKIGVKIEPPKAL